MQRGEETAFRARRISDRVWWVGAIDWGLRNFHGYLTSRGTTYNAFVVTGPVPTLIDTVKAPFYDEMLARIRSVIDPSEIQLVVSNHSEMDHSGGLPRFVEQFRPEKVLASRMGAEALKAHFAGAVSAEVVRSGDRIDLGDTGLRIVETPMLHWPDSMLSYLEDGGVLFSNDAFGMHLAGSERFADEIDGALLRHEAAKYYANILMPLSPIVARLLDRLPELDLEIRIVAPDHGPAWREGPDQIVELYRRWSAQEPTARAVVVYDTMWQSTALMARAIADGLTHGGAEARLMPLEGSHRSDVATELLEAGALLVGSPTMNNRIYPTLADATTYLAGLGPRNLVGASFGSYGWSGEAVAHLRDRLEEMGVELVNEGLKVKYVPGKEDLARCRALGQKTAKKVRENARPAG
ncbi:MAG: FprA family A-type flavoprotein [Polyangia bacterium]